MNPLPVDFYRICDELGLLCFQDLPINLFNRSNDSEDTFLENWKSYYDYLNQLSTQFSSVSGIGINFQLDGASNKHFDLLNNFQSIIRKSTIPKYIIILNHHPELHHMADFQIIEIAKRNELQEQLNFISENF